MLDFESAVSHLKKGKDEIEQAKLTLFIHANRDFLKRTFENKQIPGIPVKIGEDIENFDTYALIVVDELRKIKEQALTKIL